MKQIIKKIFKKADKTCRRCKVGTYKEMSIQDDWDGMNTCPECGHRIDTKVIYA